MAFRDIYLDPVYTETLSPERFIETYAKQDDKMQTAYVIPPRLGDPGFGKILVVWKTPTYIMQGLKTHGRSSSRRRRRER
jgi:hypothetical protein